MKFIQYVLGEEKRIGVLNLDETKLTDVSKILNKEFESMIDFITNFSDDDLKKLKLVNSMDYTIEVKDVKVCSPITKPIHDIICIGVNYKEHLDETKEHFKGNFKESQHAVYFTKRTSYILGTNEHIIKSPLDSELDYEIELAVIIGKKGVNISINDAEEYIFGYSIFNDISSRNLQAQHQQWFRGKSLDTYSIMGPCILHKSVLSMPIELDIKSYLNDKIRQNSNTKFMIRNIPEIISEISQGITLEPGDIIITGTPSGVGIGMNPKGYMKKGDTIICEIEKIGKISNEIN